MLFWALDAIDRLTLGFIACARLVLGLNACVNADFGLGMHVVLHNMQVNLV